MDKLSEARKIINRVDAEMARLFEERMGAVKTVAEYKAERGLEICDPEREAEVVRAGVARISDPEISSYYVSFLRSTMAVPSRLAELALWPQAWMAPVLLSHWGWLGRMRESISPRTARTGPSRPVSMSARNPVTASPFFTVSPSSSSFPARKEEVFTSR